MKSCRAALIAAPASGQGKTTITAALARQAVQQGKRVRVFKTGPDFLDPMIHERASGAPCLQLDLFMGGEAHCRALLAEAAATADLILVEGVMGMFDGRPSSADLAEALGLPVLLVIDAQGMADTFGVIAHGLAGFRSELQCAGVIANRVGSEGHAKMLMDSLPGYLPGIGWMPREARITLPERHLGLLPAAELTSLDKQLDIAAAALHTSFERWPEWSPEYATAARETPEALLAGKHIAIARDEAFCFIYPANLDALQSLGATVSFFSPLADAGIPECDAVWLPGGYPELHAARIAANQSMQLALLAHHSTGKPILAECGGMMSLFETIVTADGALHEGFGLLTGAALMQSKLAALGLQEVDLPEGRLRGHSFHYSRCDTPLEPIARCRNPNRGTLSEAIYRVDRLTASYMHFYFPSNLQATAALFQP
jgi:cobyrinic acid a,c-diamide synthase